MTLHRPLARLALLLTLAAAPAVASERVAPEPYHPALAALVTQMLSSEHFAGVALDDTLSARWFDTYLESLDYGRMFFLASDIAAFEKWRLTLDDAARRGEPDLAAAFHMHAVYRQRVSERINAALAGLDAPLDFTLDERFALDRSEAPWPATAAEADELWRLRTKEQILRGILRGDTEEKQKEILRKRYKRIETDTLAAAAPDVVETFLGALAKAHDPHSDYFKPATNDDFDIQMSNSLEGIGATLRTDGEYTVVVSLVTGGPAELGGELKAGDRIVAVAQGDGEPVDVIDTRIDRVVKLIRGAKGTEVRLTVIPAEALDPSKTSEIRIVRDQVKLTANDAQSKVIEVPVDKGDPLKLGVITVPSFYQDFAAKRRGDPDYKSTTRDVAALLIKLKQQRVDGVILDLRRNGGGSLSEAVDLTGLFIPQGPVVQIGDRKGRSEPMHDPDPGIAWEGPLVVLTSPLSASASEILAGAVQDYGRGLVVGSAQTHGKGTVQNVVDLDPVLRHFYRYPGRDEIAGALKVTTHKFYRVSGASTQLEGVKADVVIPSPWDGLDLLESDLPNPLPWDRVRPLEYRRWGELDTTAQSLQALSHARVSQHADFTELLDAIEKRRDDDGLVSLNLETRRAELAQGAEAPEVPEEGEAEEDGGDDIVLDEATLVMRDWLTGVVSTASKK